MKLAKTFLFTALAILTALSTFRCSSTDDSGSSSRGSLPAGVASGKF